MRRNAIVIFLFVILFLLFSFYCQAEVIELVVEDSPYYIFKDLIIKEGQTFIIEPCVVINVAKNANMTIRGRIKASGYPRGGEVIFKAIGPHQNYHKGFWQGIIIESNQENIIEYTVIQHAKTGIEVRPGACANIINNIITQNKTGIITQQADKLSITRNSFLGNFSDIVLQETEGAVESNFFQGSLKAITLKESYPDISNNYFKQLRNSAIESYNKHNFRLGENWWGSADREEIKTLIIQKGGGRIIFEPFLEKMPDLRKAGVDLKENPSKCKDGKCS